MNAMSDLAPKKATYEDLYSIPENMTGEIIDGELIVGPRPARRHGYTASSLGSEIIPPYQFGRNGGPGGWVVIIEPEIGLGKDILVPDLAGWKTERYPREEPHNWISVIPDWICEILSPSTIRLDRITKMSRYAGFGVPYVWLADPNSQTLEVFQLDAGAWKIIGLYAGDDPVRAEPFHEIEFSLDDLWQDKMINLPY